jgi:hypothetical protein
MEKISFKFKLVVTLLMMLGSIAGRAQNDVDFVINKIITNYPGYKFKWNQSEDSFRNWGRNLVRENPQDTFKALCLIVRRFQDQHLAIYNPGKNFTDDTIACTNKLREINSYLQGPGTKKKREGYWLNSYKNCVVGLRLIKANPETYEAVVIENNSYMLVPGVVLGKMEKEEAGKYVTDYRSPFMKGRFFLTTTFRNDTVFTTGAEGKWRKLNNYSNPILPERFAAVKAFGRKLDNENYLISFPGCSAENGRILDSLLKADSSVLAKSKNLIIDIRGNMGGQSSTYWPLQAWICTGPIVRPHRYMYPTEEMIADYLHDVEEEQKKYTYDSSDCAYVEAYVQKMRSHIGSCYAYRRDTFVYDEMPRPKNVAVIMDFSCQSAAELLILSFKQSKKVTFFGEHSMGAVDYLDYSPIKTPIGKYPLYIASSRRTMEPGGELDGKGIYPDVSISDNEKDWVGFVKRYYSEKERGEMAQ